MFVLKYLCQTNIRQETYRVLGFKKSTAEYGSRDFLKLHMSAIESFSYFDILLGDYYRKIRSRQGGKGAALATAHKLARMIYQMLLEKKEFDIDKLKFNQDKIKAMKIKNLEKQLTQLKEAC